MNDAELKELALKHGAFNYTKTAYDFVRDPRVAMSLMEKCIGAEFSHIEIDSGFGKGWEVANVFAGEQPYRYTKAFNESLPRAIVEACVSALEGTSEK